MSLTPVTSELKVPPNKFFYYFGVAGVILSCLFALGILFFYNPAQFSFYPFCVFHRLTGWYCPGCGSLRASYQLLHGNLLAAFHYNALAVIAVPCVGVFCLLHRKDPSKYNAILYSSQFVKAIFVIFIIYTILRNLPIIPFVWLAPH